MVAGCGEQEKRPASADTNPVILFAVDGMEWSVMKPLIDAGRMPAVKSLMERGTYGYLESMTPTYSPAIWTGAGP
jgi:predicted AlkP superfamily phosphohydrolase/phosphomutase